LNSLIKGKEIKMRKILFLSVLFILSLGMSLDVLAQAKLVVGEVTSVNSEKIVLTTKDGSVDAVLTSKTEYKRVPPENPTLKAAVDTTFEEIGVGDKLAITGKLSDDNKTIYTQKVFVMTKSSIVQKQAKESEEWKTRGITGKVEEVNPETKQITVSSRTVMGETKTILTPKEDAIFHRYAPDSVKFSEAVQSSFSEVKKGDMIRAIGNKGADGSTFTAEEIITGAFQTTAGTVTAVNPEKNEVTISDISTKKEVTVVIGKTSTLKEFPAEVAERLARIQMMRASGMTPPQGTRPGGGEGQDGNRAGAGGQGNGQGQGGGRGMGGGSIDEMLERFPEITVADLKVGQMIAVSSTKTDNAQRITAIKLLSGVEPFLTQPQMPSGGRGGNRQGGQSSGFSIPGLDEGGGISIP
jgi:ribosomal protein L24